MSHYKFICKTLLHTIKESKILYYSNKITTSENKLRQHGTL